MRPQQFGVKWPSSRYRWNVLTIKGFRTILLARWYVSHGIFGRSGLGEILWLPLHWAWSPPEKSTRRTDQKIDSILLFIFRPCLFRSHRLLHFSEVGLEQLNSWSLFQLSVCTFERCFSFLIELACFFFWLHNAAHKASEYYHYFRFFIVMHSMAPCFNYAFDSVFCFFFPFFLSLPLWTVGFKFITGMVRRNGGQNMEREWRLFLGPRSFYDWVWNKKLLWWQARNGEMEWGNANLGRWNLPREKENGKWVWSYQASNRTDSTVGWFKVELVWSIWSDSRLIETIKN